MRRLAFRRFDRRKSEPWRHYWYRKAEHQIADS